MMSGVPLETCWAFSKLWNNKFCHKLHLVGISTEWMQCNCKIKTENLKHCRNYACPLKGTKQIHWIVCNCLLCYLRYRVTIGLSVLQNTAVRTPDPVTLNLFHIKTKFGPILNESKASPLLNLLAPEFYIQILAHSVCKMWIIQEPKNIALWNKRHFEEKNGERAACLKYPVLIFAEKKYIKCNIWRVAVRPPYI